MLHGIYSRFYTNQESDVLPAFIYLLSRADQYLELPRTSEQRAVPSGIILPAHVHELLLPAIESVFSGLWVIDPELLGVSALPGVHEHANYPADGPGLTEQEHRVLMYVADGMANKEIADVLAITERTVKFHINAILKKLQAASRTDAVVIAIRRGLLPL